MVVFARRWGDTSNKLVFLSSRKLFCLVIQSFHVWLSYKLPPMQEHNTRNYFADKPCGLHMIQQEWIIYHFRFGKNITKPFIPIINSVSEHWVIEHDKWNHKCGRVHVHGFATQHSSSWQHIYFIQTGFYGQLSKQKTFKVTIYVHVDDSESLVHGHIITYIYQQLWQSSVLFWENYKFWWFTNLFKFL
jgi:hypothetical protein